MRWSALIITAALILTGCGGSDTDSDPQVDAAPTPVERTLDELSAALPTADDIDDANGDPTTCPGSEDCQEPAEGAEEVSVSFSVLPAGDSAADKESAAQAVWITPLVQVSAELRPDEAAAKKFIEASSTTPTRARTTPSTPQPSRAPQVNAARPPPVTVN